MIHFLPSRIPCSTKAFSSGNDLGFSFSPKKETSLLSSCCTEAIESRLLPGMSSWWLQFASRRSDVVSYVCITRIRRPSTMVGRGDSPGNEEKYLNRTSHASEERAGPCQGEATIPCLTLSRLTP